MARAARNGVRASKPASSPRVSVGERPMILAFAFMACRAHEERGECAFFPFKAQPTLTRSRAPFYAQQCDNRVVAPRAVVPGNEGEPPSSLAVAHRQPSRTARLSRIRRWRPVSAMACSPIELWPARPPTQILQCTARTGARSRRWADHCGFASSGSVLLAAAWRRGSSRVEPRHHTRIKPLDAANRRASLLEHFATARSGVAEFARIQRSTEFWLIQLRRYGQLPSALTAQKSQWRLRRPLHACWPGAVQCMPLYPYNRIPRAFGTRKTK